MNERIGYYRIEIRILTLLFLVSIVSCNNSNQIKRVTGNEFDREGYFINDSLPDGEVKYYLTGTNNLVAINHFKEGILHGNSINYHNGRIIQILNYESGLQNGFSNLFDSAKSYLTQRVFYFHGKQLGPSFQYDSTGKIVEYMFKNFENGELFYSYIDSSNNYVHEDFEKLITINVERIIKNNQEQLRLFTYLIYPPAVSIEYKVGYFDEDDNQVDSIVLSKSDEVFWEGYIDFPTSNKKPAFIVNIYDSSTQKKKTILNYIDLRSH